MNFINNTQKDRLKQLFHEDRTHHSDKERQALFYIIAGNDDLWMKRYVIYNIKEQRIITKCFESVDFSSGIKVLVSLGFNLYNNFHTEDTDTRFIDLIGTLDQDNFILAINAIMVRRYGIQID